MPAARSILAPLFAGLVVAFGVLLVRGLGWLNAPELALHDAYLRRAQRDGESQVVLVEITEGDIRAQGHWPISDRRLAEALQALADAGVAAIGLDLYRDLPVSPGVEFLAGVLREEERIVAVMKFGDPTGEGIPAPSALEGSGRVGFNDLLPDAHDEAIRRSLLFQGDAEGNVASSLAVLVAQKALAAEGIHPRPDPDQPRTLRLGAHTLPPLAADHGGYQGIDAAGYQQMMDYGTEDFPTFSLGELLAGEIPESQLRDRVAILGSNAKSLPDVFPVPLGGRLPGIAIHAHAVDQLLRTARGQSRPQRVWSETQESLLVVAVSLLGSLLGMRTMGRPLLGPSTLVISVAAGIGVLLLAGYQAFAAGWWIPMTAPALAWLGSAGVLTAWVSSRESAQRNQLMGIFARHVSPRLADEIWEHRNEFLAGGRPRPQRLVASVLFVDMKGYTARAESMDPTTLMNWVNEFMERMANEVARAGGVVDDYFGDGLKANFGVPVPRSRDEDIAQDARNAVHSALAMARALEELNRSYRERQLPECAMRIGIHTGPVVAGSLGSEKRLKYTVVGDVVVAAQRLESTDAVAHDFTKFPTRILASEATCGLLGDDFSLEPLGHIPLKGKEQSLNVHRVLGRRNL
ncbi:MAG: adenylate/guanylate cyclase domain-containing protein [Myxococcales bacterium]|nr:adenylate/guanylate cyclase domain-containing protein [Myxococcales bacterium]